MLGEVDKCSGISLPRVRGPPQLPASSQGIRK